MLYTKLQNAFARHELTEEEQEICFNAFSSRTLERKEVLLREGSLCRHLVFVDQGCLRAYAVGRNGVRQSIQFAIEGWVITDLLSFLTEEPSVHGIDAVEDSEVLLMDKAGRDRVLIQVPKFEHILRPLMEASFIAGQRRLNGLTELTLEERYKTLARQYPELIRRVPQMMLAQYLGVAPETLSRATKQMGTKCEGDTVSP